MRLATIIALTLSVLMLSCLDSSQAMAQESKPASQPKADKAKSQPRSQPTSKPGSRPASRPKSGIEQGPPTTAHFPSFSFEPDSRWRKIHKTTSMRHAQYLLPEIKKGEGDALLVVYYFGPTGAGGVTANIARWKDQFIPPKGKTSDEVSKTSKVKADGIPLTLLETIGTYDPGQQFAASGPQKDWMLLAAVVDVEGGAYYIKTTGPAKTINHYKNAWYLSMIKIKAAKGTKKGSGAK